MVNVKQVKTCEINCDLYVMPCLVVKINFSKKKDLTEIVYRDIKQNVKHFIKENPSVFSGDNKKIFMNFEVKEHE